MPVPKQPARRYKAPLMLIADSPLPGRLASRHILAIEGLSPGEITLLLDLAEAYVEQSRKREKKSALMRGLTVINLFFENSTRTRTSFELAGISLGRRHQHVGRG